MNYKSIISVFTLFFLMSEFAFAHGFYTFYPILLLIFILFSFFTFIEIGILKFIMKRKTLSFLEFISCAVAFIISFGILYIIYLIFGYNVVANHTSLVIFLLVLYLTRFPLIYLGIKELTNKKINLKLILINSISLLLVYVILFSFFLSKT